MICNKNYSSLQVILVNANNCRFQLWITDAFIRYTVQTAIICVYGYKSMVKEKPVMEIISVVIQCFIGLMFAIYGIWSLLSNRKKREQAKEKFVLSLVCILAGIFLLGYVAYQVL